MQGRSSLRRFQREAAFRTLHQNFSAILGILADQLFCKIGVLRTERLDDFIVLLDRYPHPSRKAQGGYAETLKLPHEVYNKVEEFFIVGRFEEHFVEIVV